jgi:beta-lactamase class D
MLSSRNFPLYLGCIFMVFLLVGCVTTRNSPLPSSTTTPVSTFTPASDEKPELKKFFEGYSGAFALYDLNNNRYIRYDPERCAERLLPASTFKILNSLISLETGVVPDENYMIKWDGTQYPTASWNRDHTFKTAFQNSVVWYYQELARRVGRENMQHYVDLVNYGNRDISGNLDNFWLDGKLRISAVEQVEFLKRLYSGDLPFSQRSIKIVKEIMVLEDTPTYQFSGKTGAGQMDAVNVGWFVGYINENDNVYFFAANIKGSDPDVNGVKAKEITQDILQDLGLR